MSFSNRLLLQKFLREWIPAFRHEMHTVMVRHNNEADTINIGGLGQTFSSKGISQGPALDHWDELELCSLDTIVLLAFWKIMKCKRILWSRPAYTPSPWKLRTFVFRMAPPTVLFRYRNQETPRTSDDEPPAFRMYLVILSVEYWNGLDYIK